VNTQLFTRVFQYVKQYLLVYRRVLIFISSVVLILSGAIGLWKQWQVGQSEPVAIMEATPTPIPLPQGWSEETPANEQTIFKAKQATESGSVATIVVIKSAKMEDQDAEIYTAQLVKAAKKALPSLRYSADIFEQRDNFAVRFLSGQVKQSGQTTVVEQRLYVIGNDVFTFTASYPSEEQDVLSGQVQEIFSQLEMKFVFR
jgi:hypothetical protein